MLCAVTPMQAKRVRLVGWLFAPPSFALGGWLLLDPSGFWTIVGAPTHNAFAQAIYGGAILGEGSMFALCAWRPKRFSAILLYLVIYKVLACLGAALVVIRGQAAPTHALAVIAAWGIAGVIAAWAYPWGDSVMPADDH